MVITSLDRITKLSRLQKELLAIGLRRHYQSQFIRSLREGFTSKNRSNPNASRRALGRLAARGLVERVSWGHWQVTEFGVEIASQLWPEITPESVKPTPGELAMISAVARLGSRFRARPRRVREGPRMSKAEADAQFERMLRSG